MKKIEDNLVRILVVVVLLGILIIGLLILSSDKYEEELNNLREEVKTLKIENNTIKKESDTYKTNWNECKDEYKRYNYVVEPTENGFYIDDKLYILEEGYEAFE